MEGNSSDYRKRSKDQEQQVRRPKPSGHNAGVNPGGPLFAKLKKKDGDDQIKKIFGSYDDFPKTWNKQVRYLGVADSTPKTTLPTSDGKQSSAKLSSHSSTSLGPLSTGTSSSRHQVAEPPTGQPLTSAKRDKSRQSSKHAKLAQSLQAPASRTNKTGLDKVPEIEVDKSTEDESRVTAQPTNILRVSKPNKATVKQKKTSSLKSGLPKDAKHRPKKSHSSSQLLATSEKYTTGPSNQTATGPSPQAKSKKQSSVPPPPLPQDPLTSHSSDLTVPSALKSFKRTSSAGTATSKTGKQEHRTESSVPSDAVIVDKIIKKKAKKKKPKKEKETILSPIEKSEYLLSTNQDTAQSHMNMDTSATLSHDTHVPLDVSEIHQPSPVSLKVQLPKQKRPNDLHITTTQFVNEDSTMDADNVSTMLQELLNPIPSRLVTPIPTPIKARPFEFPTTSRLATTAVKNTPAAISKPEDVSVSLSRSLFAKPANAHSVEPIHLKTKRPLCSTSSDEESDDSKNREALATALSTLDSSLAAESDSTAPSFASTRQRTSSVCSSSSGSSSSGSSSDSSSDSESDSEAETEVNITPTLEKLTNEMSLPTTTITPIKRTPPHSLAASSNIISPLALDESANLTPAKNRPTWMHPSHYTNKALITQGSVGFNPIPLETQGQVQSEYPNVDRGLPQTGDNVDNNMDCEVSDSDSSSGSSSDSGSESDSESSDSDDQPSDVENMEINKMNIAPFGQSNLVPTNTNLNVSQSSEDGMPFDSSGGFMEGTDFFASFGNVPGLSTTSSNHQLTSHSDQQMFSSDSTQPFTVTSQPSSITSTTLHQPIPSPVVNETQPFSDQTGKKGRKRKKSSLQRTARKAPKLTIKEAASTFNQNEIQGVLPNVGDKHFSKRTISITSTSSEYHSEEGEVSSETEDQPVFLSQPNTAPTNQMPSQSHMGTHQGHTSSLYSHPSRTGGEATTEQLVVRFPLTDLKRVPDQHKPKATVEPYIIRQTSDSRNRSREQDQTPSERGGHDDPRASRGMSHDRSNGRTRDNYGSVSGSRHREDYGRGYHRERSNDRPRSRREGGSSRWERESSRDRRPYNSGRGWDRDRDYPHGDDYWADEHGDYGGERSRGRRGGYGGGENQSYPERYMAEARRKKHEADKMQPASVDKAKAYMDSVVLFMKYGDATEQQRDSSTGSGAPKKTSAYRTYNETLTMIKFCQNMAGDCKPLVVLCMRCQSVLLWRMYLLKMPTAVSIEKELQEYFVPPKAMQGKSPYPNSSSPLPSPASVGSTTSTGSGGWASTQDPSPSVTVNVPKHIVNKATEHLTISSYVNQSLELWKTSEALMYQCRDYFTTHDRNAGQRLNHCSPVSHVANWTEKILRNFRYNTY